MYYVAIFLDPILRFNWIFYAIYGNDLQHSAILSFIIGVSEVFRRGMWTIFRVENEHCTNVGRFRASRDIPLPYSIPATSEESFPQSPSAHENGETRRRPPSARSAQTGTGASTDQDGAHLEAQRSHTRSIGDHGTPLQRNISRTTTFLHAAHAQDFERKRMPELGERNVPDADDDDEDDDDDDEDEFGDTSSDGLGRQSADERPSNGKARTRSSLDRAMNLERDRERRS
ncbi:EXS family-domain-containing protein [Phyllosticta citrichinensis]|uniref:EXS family-domain-containing protein n=1 Tax=Phyllosticta citrichinensis TaxID=1130410 RepID=A0ABR1XY69_9PEZI